MLLPSLMLVTTALIHLVLCPLLVFGWGPFGGLGHRRRRRQHADRQRAWRRIVLAAYLLRRDGAVQLQRSPWRLRMRPAARHPARGRARIAEPGDQQCIDRRGHRVRRQLRHRRAGRLWRGGTARIHPGADRVRLRHGAHGDGRHQHGRRASPARALRVPGSAAPWSPPSPAPSASTAAIAPSLWMNLFTATIGGAQLRRGRTCNIVGGCYGLFGLGLALFFASQGAGRMFWPLAGSAARLVIVARGRLGLRAPAAHVGERLLRRCRGEPGRLCDHDRGGIWRGGWTNNVSR